MQLLLKSRCDFMLDWPIDYSSDGLCSMGVRSYFVFLKSVEDLYYLKLSSSADEHSSQNEMDGDLSCNSRSAKFRSLILAVFYMISSS